MNEQAKDNAISCYQSDGCITALFNHTNKCEWY